MSLKIEDLDPKIQEILNKITSKRYKIEYISSIAVHIDLSFEDMLSIVRQLIEEDEKLSNLD